VCDVSSENKTLCFFSARKAVDERWEVVGAGAGMLAQCSPLAGTVVVDCVVAMVMLL